MESLVRRPTQPLFHAHAGSCRPARSTTPFFFSYPPTQTSSEQERPRLFGQAPPPATASASPKPSKSGFSISAPPFFVQTHVPSAVQEAPGPPLVLNTHCELPAVARGRARDSFSVLVRAKASGVAAVREAWIAVSCPHPDVRVRAIKSSGRHESCVVANGRGGLVRLGDLGAGEERRFLLFVNVPSAAAEDDDDDVTRLVRVSCAYRDAATGKTAVVIGEDAFVRRPAEVTSQEDQKPSVEVQVERFRLQATAGPFAKYAGNERHHGFAIARKISEQQRKLPATTIPSSSWPAMMMPNNRSS